MKTEWYFTSVLHFYTFLIELSLLHNFSPKRYFFSNLILPELLPSCLASFSRFPKVGQGGRCGTHCVKIQKLFKKNFTTDKVTGSSKKTKLNSNFKQKTCRKFYSSGISIIVKNQGFSADRLIRHYFPFKGLFWHCPLPWEFNTSIIGVLEIVFLQFLIQQWLQKSSCHHLLYWWNFFQW